MEDGILQQLTEEIERARLESNKDSLARQQQEVFMQKEDVSMVKEQLDLTDQLTRMDYLLKGYSLQPDKQGNLVWSAPTDSSMEVFSDYGIQLIMNTVSFYLNKNTLLSNYKEEEIKQKMLEFTKELIWAIFMNYEKVFKYPSVKECIDHMKRRLKRRAEVTAYAHKLKGIEADEDAIYKLKVIEIEDKIEEEIEKIRQNLIKEKLKRFPLLCRVIQDTVHSTYQRAWNGQERASIRQHMTISETKGNVTAQPPKSGGLFSWGKH